MLVLWLVLALTVSVSRATFSNFDGSIPMCNKLASQSSHTMWEQYLLDVCNGNALQPKCMPSLTEPQLSPTGKRDGVLVLFHGYSACPGAYDDLVSFLSAKLNLNIYRFLFPGHGRRYNDCIVLNECADGYPTEGLPTSKQPYIDLVKRAVDITRNEVQRLGLSSDTHMIAVSGLSHGGPAAAYASVIGDGLFNHQLIFNGFFGISNFKLDDLQATCKSFGMDSDVCSLALLNLTLAPFGLDKNETELIKDATNQYVQNFLHYTAGVESNFFEGWAEFWNIFRNQLTFIVESPLPRPGWIDGLLSMTFGWGQGCIDALSRANRGGMCSFKVKNIIGAHSFAQYALAQSRLIHSMKRAQFITVERDGLTRNSMSWQAIQASIVNGNPTNVCMYRLEPGCTEPENICGVPHSMLDPTDNILLAPHTIYWKPFTYDMIFKFLSGYTGQLGVNSFDGTNTDQCVVQSPSSPNKDLVGFVNRAGILTLEPTLIPFLHGSTDPFIYQMIANAVQEPSWTIMFYRLEDVQNKGLNKFLIEFPNPKAEQNLIDKIVNGSVLEFSALRVISYYQENTHKLFTRQAFVQ